MIWREYRYRAGAIEIDDRLVVCLANDLAVPARRADRRPVPGSDRSRNSSRAELSQTRGHELLHEPVGQRLVDREVQRVLRLLVRG